MLVGEQMRFGRIRYPARVTVPIATWAAHVTQGYAD
jgi:hypothetical protein